MQSLISAMTTFRKAFLSAVVKSLLRGRSLLQAILAFWVAPQSLPAGSPRSRGGGKGSRSPTPQRSLDDFLAEAERLLLGPVAGHGLRDLSAGLRAQFRERLLTSAECMLPSYNHLLPTGREAGRYLAVDVGGSTLRVALVELTAASAGAGTPPSHRVVGIRSFKIDAKVKSLEGMAFFDWMADRIIEVMAAGLKPDHSADGPLPISLAWSFPVE